MAIAERKLSNYTVLYGVYECPAGHLVESGNEQYCKACDINVSPTPEVRVAHLKAPSPYEASQCAESRALAVLEGHIVPALL